jgi:glycosyltransferase involved in cell wall biosynthesis
MNPTNRHVDVLPSREAGFPNVRAPSQASGEKPSVVWRAKAVPLRRSPAAPAKRPRISVVIPALNEAKNLEHVLPALPDGLFEVILVDGASVDATVATAKRLRPDVRLVHQTRSGKGNALACGFAASRGDIIVMLDADGSADPGEIPRFVEALLGGADFAKGSRRLEGGGSADITRIRSLGNRFLSFLVNRLSGSDYTDLCYGYNAFWATTCLSVLGLDWRSPPAPGEDGRLWGDGFEIETLITIRVARAGLKVIEVPSYELPRLHGVSNLNAPKDGVRVLRTILAEDRRARRLRDEQRKAHREPWTAGSSATLDEPASEARRKSAGRR